MPRNKTSKFVARKRWIAIAISACFSSAPAWANPTGPQVVNGSASISQAGKLLTVSNSNGAIINWNSFSIAADEATRFNQPSAASSVLNRVIANDPSVLLGTLSSNGRVWLVNPAGIMVGQGAQIDVAGFVASTLNVRNEDFLAGRLNFGARPGAGSIETHGRISTPSGGSVYLVAPEVENHGIINAPNGEVLLAAGQTVQIVDTGTPGVTVDITGAEGGVTNLGEIVAEAGRIGMAGVLVKNSGTVNASSIVKQGGRVFLRASKDLTLDAASQVRADAGGSGNGGNISAWAEDTARIAGGISAKGGSQFGDGGFIETSGAHVKVANSARISTQAAQGKTGTWLIDPNDFTIAASGGDMTGAQVASALDSNDFAIQTATMGTAGNGDIFVNDSIAKTGTTDTTLTLLAERNIEVNGPISSTNSKLHVNLFSDSDGLNGGSIVLNAGSSISSHGGNVTLAGGPGGASRAIGTAANRTGIRLGASTVIDAGGGDIVLLGVGYNDPLNSNNKAIEINGTIQTTGIGSVTIIGQGGDGTSSNYGIRMNSIVTTDSGDVTITGTAGAGSSSDNHGLEMAGPVQTGSGNIFLTGTGGSGTTRNKGIFWTGTQATVTSTSGNISITGTGGAGTGDSNRGIELRAPVQTGGGGSITIMGTAGNAGTSQNYGVQLGCGDCTYTTTITTGGGLLDITGHGGGAGDSNYGIYTSSVILDTSNGANLGGGITLNGVAGSGASTNWFNFGVDLDYGTSIRTGGGALEISGIGGGAGSYGYGIYTSAYLDTSRSDSIGGAITLDGTGANGTHHNHGLVADAGAKTVTGGGNLTITGTGGGTAGNLSSDNNAGMYFYEAAFDTGNGTGGGNVALLGTGGPGDYNNVGVDLSTGTKATKISTGGGALSVTGTGGGAGSDNWGISTGNASLDTSTGNGAVGGSMNLTGTGGNGTSWNVGVYMYKYGANATSLTTGGGTLQVEGYGGGASDYNHGIYAKDALLRSERDVTVLGQAGTGANSSDILVGGSNILHAGSDGAGIGTVSLGSSNASVNAGGHVDIYYNPASYVSSDPTSSDSSHNPYGAQVSGSGTYTAWMLVNDVNQLQAMNSNLAGNYALGRDIDATATATWNGGLGFDPIGDYVTRFAGKVDGLEHTISGLNINRPIQETVGLFGAVASGGTVTNMGLVASSVTGAALVGGLTGENYGTIDRCFNNGVVSAVNYSAGGLVGYNGNGASISNAYATGTVTSGTSGAGGLVGENWGMVDTSYSSGSVIGGGAVGNHSIGGLVGINVGSIDNSYALGNVTGFQNVGGLVGNNYGTVDFTYSSGEVNGSLLVGGLVGSNATNTQTSVSGTVSSSFWDNETSGISSTGIGGTTNLSGVTSLSTAAAMLVGSYTGWNFGSIWWMSTGNTRPFLRSEWGATIHNAHQLQLMAMDMNAGYALANDIEMPALTESGMWNTATGFVPLGTYFGEFDGANHTIGNLFINRPGSDRVGLFSKVGNTPGAVVKNVGLVGGSVTGNMYVGALAGQVFNATIENSYSTASVDGSSYVGGLVGDNYNSSISNSYSTGSVSGGSQVGGLVGNNDVGATASTIGNSYAAGLVSGTGADVGGLVGLNSGTVTGSFWDLDTSGTSTGIGTGTTTGAIGMTIADMMAIANFNSATAANGNVNPGWSIANDGGSSATWRIYEGATAPLLRSFLKPLTATANAATKTYDGSAYFDAAGVSYSVASPSLSGTLAFEDSSAHLPVVNAGSYAIAPTGLYSDQRGYDISYASGALTVDPYTVSLSGSRPYDGTVNLAASIFGLGTLVGSETLTLSGAGTMADKNVGTAKAVTLGTLALGDGSNGGLASNYTLAGGTHAVDIAQAQLTLSTGNVAKTYDGGLTAIGTPVVVAGTLFAGDALSGGAFAYTDKNAGSGNKTVTTSGVTVGDGVNAGNYSVIYADNVTSTINPYTVSLSGSRAYDGTANLAAGIFGFGTLAGSETLTLSGIGTMADKNVGTGKAVTPGTLALGNGSNGGLAANYTLAGGTHTTAITPSPLTIAATGDSRIYDGTTASAAMPTVTGTVYAGDSVTGLAQSFDSKNAGARVLGLSSGYSVNDGNGGANYDLTVISTASGSITPASLTGSVTASNKVYDATTVATISGRALGGAIAGDAVSLSGGTASFADKNVGTAKAVTATGFALSGTDAGNYVLANGSAVTVADITQRPLSTWTGGASGDWSLASNWDALPDQSNVLAVTIPAGASVNYDAAVGSTHLASLTAAGLNIIGGSLNIADSLSVSSSFSQSGGTLSFGPGASASITQASGDLNVPLMEVAGLNLAASAGAITQSGRIAALTLTTQSQGATTLTNPDNQISGRVDMSAGGPLKLWASGDLNLGAIDAGANAAEIKAGGAILQAPGAENGVNLVSGSADLASIFGGVSGGLAISANTQVGGALVATVGAQADFGGIRIENSGAAPSSVTLTDNALAGAGVSFLNGGDIGSTSGYALKTLTGGDLALLSGGSLTWNGGSLDTPTGSVLLSAEGGLAVTGALTSSVDLALSSATSITVSGSLATQGTGTAALTAPSVSLNGSISAADDVGVIADAISLGNGSSTSAGHDAIFAATNVAATNATVSASHDISVAVTGDLRLNGSSFAAGNDIFINMLGADSTLYLNDTAGLPPAFLWAQAPSTIYLDFPARTSGGYVVDGAQADLLSYVTSEGGSGLFYGPAKMPATYGAGLQLAYAGGSIPPSGGGIGTEPTIVDAVAAAINAVTTTTTQATGAAPPVVPPTGAGPQDGGGGPLNGEQTVGGTEGTFGAASDENGEEKKEENKTDEGTGLKKKADKPTAKKLATCS